MAQNKKTSKAETLTPKESIVTVTTENITTEQLENTPFSGSSATSELEPVKAQEQQLKQEPRIEEIPLPFNAVVNVALAVLRKAPNSPLMDIRPVGTLPLGTPVTITALHAGCAQLRNGLWIKAEFLTPNSAKDTP